jgi:Cu+-exporting ATPase
MSDIPVENPEHFEEIPGAGISGIVDGRAVKIGSASFVGFDPSVQPVQHAPSGGIFVAIDNEIPGFFEVKSRYRDGLAEVLDFFRQGGKSKGRVNSEQANKTREVWLVSGDQDQEAGRLKPFFPDPDTMFFGRNPQDKLEFVKKLQRHGENVLMLGDGLNDAGALRQSDMGIVVAENTNNFTPACDGILHADEFERLPQFITLARAGVRIVNRSYVIALVYNLLGLSYAITGTLSPLIAAILMPLSSVTIVLFGVCAGNIVARRLKAC